MTLRRVLGASDAAWLVAGNMIGAGIFLTPGLVVRSLPGAGWVLLAWVAGGALALAGAAVYAELGTRIPRAGGDYRYLQDAFGGPWGFLTGWAGFLLTFSGAAAAMAITSAGYFRAAVGEDTPFGVFVGTAGGPMLVLVLIATNVLGARVSGKATAILTALPLIGLALLFGYGAITGAGTVTAPPEPFRPPPGPWPLAFGVAMLPVFFTYSGWNAAAYVAGEVRDPALSLPRGLLSGTLAVTALYLTVNVFLLWTVPPDVLASSNTPGAEAARRLLGPHAERWFSLCIAIAIAGSTNVTLLAGSRIYYAMARDRLAPAAIGRTNRRGAPSTALWASGIWATILTLFGTVENLVRWTTLAILLLSALTAAGLFVLRRRSPQGGSFPCPGYPWVPALYILATVAVAVSTAVYDPKGALYGMLIVASGVPVYWLVTRSVRSTSSPGD